MNKLTDIGKKLEEINTLIKKNKELERALKAVDLSEAFMDNDDHKEYRLPYSSTPVAIEEPWSYDDRRPQT